MEEISPGDLVKWIIDYRVYEASDNGETFPIDAVWAYGIVIEVSKSDPMSVVLVRLDTKTHGCTRGDLCAAVEGGIGVKESSGVEGSILVKGIIGVKGSVDVKQSIGVK